MALVRQGHGSSNKDILLSPCSKSQLLQETGGQRDSQLCAVYKKLLELCPKISELSYVKERVNSMTKLYIF